MTKGLLGILALFFLLTISTLAFAEEKAPPVIISVDEVLTWEKKYLIARLSNEAFVCLFVNPDQDAKVKAVFGIVILDIIQTTPTLEVEPVLHAYAYESGEQAYMFEYVNGEYIGGPVTPPPFMQEDELDDEEPKSVPTPILPPPPKEKEVKGGTGEKMYS